MSTIFLHTKKELAMGYLEKPNNLIDDVVFLLVVFFIRWRCLITG